MLTIEYQYWLNISYTIEIFSMKCQYCRNIGFTLEILTIKFQKLSRQYCSTVGKIYIPRSWADISCQYCEYWQRYNHCKQKVWLLKKMLAIYLKIPMNEEVYLLQSATTNNCCIISDESKKKISQIIFPIQYSKRK